MAKANAPAAGPDSTNPSAASTPSSEKTSSAFFDLRFSLFDAEERCRRRAFGPGVPPGYRPICVNLRISSMKKHNAHLDALENQAIFIFREAYHYFKNIAMPW